MTEREFNIVRTTNDVLRVASACRPELTRVPRASVGYVRATRTRLPRWVRTGGAGRLAARAPAYCTYWVRAYQPRAYRAYRVPWHPRWRESGGAVFKVQLKSQVCS